LSVIGGLATLAGLPISLLTTPVAAYHTLSNFFSEPEPEPDPVPFGELGNISDAISQAQAEQQAQEIAAFGNPADDTVHGTVGGRGSPGSPSDFGGGPPADTPGDPSAAGDPAGPDSGPDSPWSTGGFVVKPLYDS
jgi:hypothetical protein